MTQFTPNETVDILCALRDRRRENARFARKHFGVLADIGGDYRRIKRAENLRLKALFKKVEQA